MRLLAVVLACAPVFAQLSFTVGNDGLATLSHNGTSYLWTGQHPMQNYYSSASSICATSTQRFQPSAVKSSGADYMQHVYRSGQTDQLTYRLTFTAHDTNTLKVVALLTNNGTDYICYSQMAPFPLTVGANTITSYTPVQASTHDSNAMVVTGPSVGLAIWHGFEHLGMRWTTTTWATGVHLPVLTTKYTKGVSHYPGLLTTYESIIGPGESKSYTAYLRFGTDTSEADAMFAAANPMTLVFPDRRRICTWFMADGSRRTANNPRGYYDGTLNALGDPATFRTTMLSNTDTAINNCKTTMNPQCQGILLWDIEGNEFNHALTYVGAPNRLAEHAPEMDAIADELIGRIRNAGLKVGFTLRPQCLRYGTSLPATCHHNATIGTYRDYLIKTDVNTTAGEFPAANRSYLCSAPDTWLANTNNNGYGYQTDHQSVAAIVNELREKISYAKRRWNASFFYIDSVVYEGGAAYDYLAVWKPLSQEFPDIAFFPEQEMPGVFAHSAPYAEMDNPDYLYQTSSGDRARINGAFRYIQSNDGDFVTGNALIRGGYLNGDIFGQRCWFGDAQLGTMNTIAQSADKDATVLTLTDSAISGTRTYTGSPRTAYTYPLVLRVAFSTSSTFTGSETTYCERRDVTYCWAAGVKQGTATLDLASFTHVRREYRDFHGRLVSAGVAETK